MISTCGDSLTYLSLLSWQGSPNINEYSKCYKMKWILEFIMPKIIIVNCASGYINHNVMVPMTVLQKLIIHTWKQPFAISLGVTIDQNWPDQDSHSNHIKPQLMWQWYLAPSSTNAFLGSAIYMNPHPQTPPGHFEIIVRILQSYAFFLNWATKTGYFCSITECRNFTAS